MEKIAVPVETPVIESEKLVETSRAATKPKIDAGGVVITLLVLVLIALGAIIYLLLRPKTDTLIQTPPVETYESVVTPSVSTVSPTISVTPSSVNGTLYTNEKYGFEFTYDAPYKVLTDKNNLYGYPNGVALIYKGGQAYDIVIESWDSKAAYESKHAGNLANITVFESKGRFITFYDNTQELGNKEIIGSVTVMP